jgi:hypothetical protein
MSATNASADASAEAPNVSASGATAAPTAAGRRMMVRRVGMLTPRGALG